MLGGLRISDSYGRQHILNSSFVRSRHGFLRLPFLKLGGAVDI